MNRTRQDSTARGLLLFSAGLLVVWLVWSVVYEATGAPGVSYLSFGLVSLPVGLVLAALSLASLVRIVRTGRSRGYAVAALLTSVALALLPWIALLSLAEDSS